jgi:hypothetical protein
LPRALYARLYRLDVGGADDLAGGDAALDFKCEPSSLLPPNRSAMMR